MKSALKLGTRKSLLAWAQSSWVARQVEKNNPGVSVELVGIETLGDRILDAPLQSIEGKEFFVAELDRALHLGEVDFTVHSMKDLSLDRPQSISCAAIPERANPRDVILFGPRALARMKLQKPLKIGTSSPRRLENIPKFLEKALPRVSENGSGRSEVRFLEIRGNVNTRLSRVHEPEESPKYLDGVVLAFAGLIRLWADVQGQSELRKLLDRVSWMVLPLKESPTAPGQGALAIECRTNDENVRSYLEKLNHPETVSQVRPERQILSDWGGGCHQRFGASCIQTEELGPLLFIRGRKSDGEEVDELRWQMPDQSNLSEFMGREIRAWDGSLWRSVETPGVRVSCTLKKPSAPLFVAHSRATEGLNPQEFASRRVWTSGVASWYRLAEQGAWVEGCAEGLGFESIQSILNEKVLQLPDFREWLVLTHQGASEEVKDEWERHGVEVQATYFVPLRYDDQAKAALRNATHVFWSSGSQYNVLKESIVTSKLIHACGPGKTASRLRKQGVRPIVFPSVEEWRKWIKLHPSV